MAIPGPADIIGIPGILIAIIPESLSTSSRNPYRHAPGTPIAMPRNTQEAKSGGKCVFRMVTKSHIDATLRAVVQ